jgi:glycerophosphoryl diester phosphodiesterase
LPTAPGDTLVIAHRGASEDHPENTFEAFEAAVRAGADMVELDVRRTSDGHLVAYHDEIAGRRYEELTAGGASSRPPLLQDVIERLAHRIALDLELKECGCEEEVVAMVARAGAEHCLITSFLEDVVRDTKALAPELRTGLVVGSACAEDPFARAHRAGADVLLLAAGLRTTVVPDLPCLVWTVNGTAAIDRFLSDPLISGVVTDRPALALERRARLSGRTAPAERR